MLGRRNADETCTTITCSTVWDNIIIISRFVGMHVIPYTDQEYLKRLINTWFWFIQGLLQQNTRNIYQRGFCCGTHMKNREETGRVDYVRSGIDELLLPWTGLREGREGISNVLKKQLSGTTVIKCSLRRYLTSATTLLVENNLAASHSTGLGFGELAMQTKLLHAEHLTNSLHLSTLQTNKSNTLVTREMHSYMRHGDISY